MSRFLIDGEPHTQSHVECHVSGLYGLQTSISEEEFLKYRDENYVPDEDIRTRRREGDYVVITDDVRLPSGEGAVRARYYLKEN